MLKALVISNNIEGLEKYYQSNQRVSYDIFHITRQFNPDLGPYDLLIVPNGSDHIAMEKIKEKVLAFLNSGKALICCDGWFTNWIPGNRWLMDNSKKSIDVRYFVKDDPHSFFEGLNIDEFIYSHGISGYWACGYINPAPGANVLLEDTWQRPIVVLDEVTTRGTILLTASGPLADVRYETSGGNGKETAPASLFQRWISYLIEVKNLKDAQYRTCF